MRKEREEEYRREGREGGRKRNRVNKGKRKEAGRVHEFSWYREG